jgi:pimeloyl-ACP methyl ester carboxylesterase
MPATDTIVTREGRFTAEVAGPPDGPLVLMLHGFPQTRHTSTLYLWGDADATVGRPAATATADFVTGPFRMETFAGVGHFITDQVAAAVTTLLLDHLAAGSVP